MKIKKILPLLVCLPVAVSIAACYTPTALVEQSETVQTTQVTGNVESTKVITGDAQLDGYLHLLKDKRVALFSDHTGIVGGLRSRTF